MIGLLLYLNNTQKITDERRALMAREAAGLIKDREQVAFEALEVVKSVQEQPFTGGQNAKRL